MAPSPLTTHPWQILGRRRNGSPIYSIAGGSVDVEPEEPDDTSTGETEEPVDDWTPPTRDEWEKLVEDKRKADGESAARRRYLRQHGIDPKTGAKLQPDPEPEPEPDEPAAKDEQPRGASKADVERAVRKAAAEAELRGLRKTKTLVVGFNEALSEAGWNGTRLGSLMKLVDLDDVEIDNDGEIIGLAEQIASIKSEWPELFKRERRAPGTAPGVTAPAAPAAKVDTADKKTAPPQPKSWADAVAQQAVRGR